MALLVGSWFTAVGTEAGDVPSNLMLLAGGRLATLSVLSKALTRVSNCSMYASLP
jgi:hypothetical protein